MQSLGKAPGTRETFLAVLDACDLMTQLQRVVGVCVIVVCVCVCIVWTCWKFIHCGSDHFYVDLKSCIQLVSWLSSRSINLSSYLNQKYPCYNIVWDLYLQSTSLNYHSIWWISLSDGGICQFITMNRISLLYYFVDWIVFFRFKYEGGGQLSDMSCPPNDLQTVHQLLEVS